MRRFRAKPPQGAVTGARSPGQAKTDVPCGEAGGRAAPGVCGPHSGASVKCSQDSGALSMYVQHRRAPSFQNCSSTCEGGFTCCRENWVSHIVSFDTFSWRSFLLTRVKAVAENTERSFQRVLDASPVQKSHKRGVGFHPLWVLSRLSSRRTEFGRGPQRRKTRNGQLSLQPLLLRAVEGVCPLCVQCPMSSGEGILWS